MNIVINPCGVDTDNITRLGDRPNTDNELSADQLKRVFDKTGADIKSFINESLLPDLERSFGEMDAALTKKPAGSGVQKAHDGELVDAVPGVDYVTALLFQNISVDAAAFVSDATYADYPYRAAVALSGVTAALVPYVAFGLTDVVDGNLAPIVESYDGGIYLYAEEEPSATLTVPTILFWRVSA